MYIKFIKAIITSAHEICSKCSLKLETNDWNWKCAQAKIYGNLVAVTTILSYAYYKFTAKCIAKESCWYLHSWNDCWKEWTANWKTFEELQVFQLKIFHPFFPVAPCLEVKCWFQSHFNFCTCSRKFQHLSIFLLPQILEFPQLKYAFNNSCGDICSLFLSHLLT